jgi:hypothetical protein
VKIHHDNLQLCTDCLMAAVNDDLTALDYHYGPEESAEREAAIRAGLERLGPYLVPHFDSETEEGIRDFARCNCDVCGTHLAGARYRFATLTND